MRPPDDLNNQIFEIAYELAISGDQQFALIWIGLAEKINAAGLSTDYSESLHIYPHGTKEGIRRSTKDLVDYRIPPNTLRVLSELVKPFEAVALNLRAQVTINLGIDRDIHILIKGEMGIVDPEELIARVNHILESYNPGSSITYDVETALMVLFLREAFASCSADGCSSFQLKKHQVYHN